MPITPPIVGNERRDALLAVSAAVTTIIDPAICAIIAILGACIIGIIVFVNAQAALRGIAHPVLQQTSDNLFKCATACFSTSGIGGAARFAARALQGWLK